MICATSYKIIDSIKHYLFWISSSQNLEMNGTCFILQWHELVWWDECPGLCTCPTVVVTCPGEVDKH